MPTYEMPILLRVMSKPETAAVLKKISNIIFEKGGFIRKIDNLGQQPVPYKIVSNNVSHKVLSNFIFHFDAPPKNILSMVEEYRRDIDIVRNEIFKIRDEDAPKIPCTWHDEMLPVPYRKQVQKLVKMSEKTRKKNDTSYKFNTGLDYYPFQR